MRFCIVDPLTSHCETYRLLKLDRGALLRFDPAHGDG